MAGTIRLAPFITVTNAGFRATFQPTTITVIQNAVGAFESTVLVGTSEEDLTIGDVATPGRVVLFNLDPTNYVTYGPKNGSAAMEAFGRIPPGEYADFRLAPSGVTIRWQANSAPVKIQVKVLED